MTARSYSNGKARVYGAEKKNQLEARKRTSVGQTTAHHAAIVWPNVPVDVFHGFTSFSTSATENTTEAVLTQRFHEGGLYQTEMGLRTGPAPNPNPNAEYNSYGAIARAAMDNAPEHATGKMLRGLVEQCLGRQATMEPNAWKREEHWTDQIAVGLANLRRHLIAVSRVLDVSIRPNLADATWTSWEIMLAFTAFSRGEGQCSICVNPYAAELSQAPERLRWALYRKLVAQDISANRKRGAIRTLTGKSSPAYAVVRSDQKLHAGRAVADPSALSWFADVCLRDGNSEDALVEDAIARAAYGASLTSIAIATVDVAANLANLTMDRTGPGGAVAIVGAIGAACVAGAMLTRKG